MEAEERTEVRANAWELCADLARSKNILAEFDRALEMVGLVGERRVAKLIYLARHISAVGPPRVDRAQGAILGRQVVHRGLGVAVLPGQAFYALTAMSDRALAYSTEPLKHRHLVIYEAAGMASDFARFARSLLKSAKQRQSFRDLIISS